MFRVRVEKERGKEKKKSRSTWITFQEQTFLTRRKLYLPYKSQIP